jgi:hypothetical protein
MGFSEIGSHKLFAQAGFELLELKTLRCQKIDTQETENLNKAISLDQEGASMCTLQLSKRTSTKWPTVPFLPHTPDAVVPAPYPGFVQVKGSQSHWIG